MLLSVCHCFQPAAHCTKPIKMKVKTHGYCTGFYNLRTILDRSYYCRNEQGFHLSNSYFESILGTCKLHCTFGVPQSQISLPSRIPFPHTGAPTVIAGSLVRHTPRFALLSPFLRNCRLQLLHLVGGMKPSTAPMMHPLASLHVQVPIDKTDYDLR